MIEPKFEQYGGYRYSNGGISILTHTLALFKENATVTNLELNNYFRATNRFLEGVDAYDPEKQQFSKILTADDFRDIDKSIPFYKYVPQQTLDHLLNDSFQFGSIQYYRNIEKQNSKDGMEGLTNLTIATPRRLIGTSLVSGYNSAILCGTSRLDKRAHMLDRFGGRIIKISNLRGFSEHVRASLGARRAYFNNVTYNDLKLFRVKTLKPFEVLKKEAPNDNFDPKDIDERIFTFLYKSSFLSSLFVKPTRFSIEQELRLVFELSKDIPDVLRITNEGLAKYIEVIQ
jgi:hypothetical protein